MTTTGHGACASSCQGAADPTPASCADDDEIGAGGPLDECSCGSALDEHRFDIEVSERRSAQRTIEDLPSGSNSFEPSA